MSNKKQENKLDSAREHESNPDVDNTASNLDEFEHDESVIVQRRAADIGSTASEDQQAALTMVAESLVIIQEDMLARHGVEQEGELIFSLVGCSEIILNLWSEVIESFRTELWSNQLLDFHADEVQTESTILDDVVETISVELSHGTIELLLGVFAISMII